MLSDEQLIEQIRTELRSELADLNPPPDLLDRLLEPAENDGRSQRGSRERSADRRDQRGWHARVHGLGTAVPVLAAVIVVVVVAAVAFTSLRPITARRRQARGSRRMTGRSRSSAVRRWKSPTRMAPVCAALRQSHGSVTFRVTAGVRGVSLGPRTVSSSRISLAAPTSSRSTSSALTGSTRDR